MLIRDRIRDLRRVPASDLRPHPMNWRTHSDRQRDILRGILAEVGYADALLARELADGSLELIDGHLRAETTPDQLVPVLVLDVDASEAAKLLATIDPLANMAGTNHELLQQVLAETSTENPELQQLWNDMSQVVELEKEAFSADKTPDLKDLNVPELYQLVVECADEAEQQALFERLKNEGFKVRVLVL
jgi:hypothetical protein